MAIADDRHRLEVAERHLALIQSFIPRLDTRVSALFAISCAEIAVAALNLSAGDFQRWYIATPLAILLVAMGVTFFNLYRCAYPHLEGGSASLIYFGEIAKRREADFIRQYKAASVLDLLDDISGQIWRNSEIVACKYRYLKNATQYATASLLPWAIVLVATALSNGRIPVISG
ncbi:Pycsar system effector family protein [Sphingobium sp. KCTC 72723]|uniref:Pycsar system effector family protein n=1 Tax=Sphingobium sp. KCTC 72723 TaxID=2733867 RepID=UPI00165E2701|nr:Pycsar system effector family protein [Sphingobium sp. KCTC 72723]